ncbi:MAG: hypothetical protein ACLP9L_05755 [Thermoguttaceae bacterium]
MSAENSQIPPARSVFLPAWKPLPKFLLGIFPGLVLGVIAGFGIGWFGITGKGHRESMTQGFRSQHDESVLRSMKMRGSARPPKSFAEIMKEENWEPNLEGETWSGKDSAAPAETPAGSGDHR